MASFALLIWPLVALLFFAVLGREKGLIWSIVTGYLLLPETTTFALPGLPDYQKLTAISISAAIGVLAFRYKSSWPELEAYNAPKDLGPMILAVWAELLELDPDDVPQDKSFRDLGGDRRMARTAVRMMVNRGLKRKTAWGLYKGSTIAELSVVQKKDGARKLGSHSMAVLFYLLLAILSLAVFATVLNNSTPLVDGGRVRSGLSSNDIVSMISEPMIALVPFFLAVTLMRRTVHFEEVLKVLVLAGAAYAVLALVEVRLSPRLNIWVYGFFQHDWRQHLRGGYRPIVFLDHGLSLGFFLLTATMASLTLFRQYTDKRRWRYLGLGACIFAVLLVSRNLGSVILAAVFMPFVLIAPKRIQTWVVAGVAIIFLAYPGLRQAELLPIDDFVEFIAENISQDRADSLRFRLENETDMALRAAEKPLFGWGGWGRARVIDDFGQDTTVADGTWIIILGERGWVGYVCFFGLLTIPMIYLTQAVKRKEATVAVCGAGLIMAANLIYLVPNSTLSPVGWFLTGTLAGFIRWHVADEDPDEEAEVDELRPFTPYTRFAQDHVRPTLSPES